MTENFRTMIDRLEKGGLLSRENDPTDIRALSALLSDSEKALLFSKINHYAMPLVGGLFWTRQRMAMALGCKEDELVEVLLRGTRNPLPVHVLKDAPVQEVVAVGDEVDLTELPIPFLNERDGGSYITSGVVIAHDDEYGYNAGMYRLMYRTPRETGIDLVSPSDLRLYYQKRFDRGEPLPLSVAVGVHGYEALAATNKSPVGVSELEVAGGMYGEPLEVISCVTNDLMVPAHAELVLEGELLPIGWTADEGPFGERAGMTGDLKWNPVFRVNALTRRRDSIFHCLLMPWENIWLGSPTTESAVRRILKEIGLQPSAVRVLEGGACKWSVVVSISNKRPGEGRDALAALLALSDIKFAIVTDDDIDIFDQRQLDWALTFKVQADKDVITLTGMKAKHIDPSVRAWELEKGGLPLTAKMGIDATIPEGIPPSYYERVKPVFTEEVLSTDAWKGIDYTPESNPGAVADRIEIFLREPRSFQDLVSAFRDVPYPLFLKAWGKIREEVELERDDEDRFQVIAAT